MGDKNREISSNSNIEKATETADAVESSKADQDQASSAQETIQKTVKLLEALKWQVFYLSWFSMFVLSHDTQTNDEHHKETIHALIKTLEEPLKQQPLSQTNWLDFSWLLSLFSSAANMFSNRTSQPTVSSDYAMVDDANTTKAIQTANQLKTNFQSWQNTSLGLFGTGKQHPASEEKSSVEITIVKSIKEIEDLKKDSNNQNKILFSVIPVNSYLVQKLELGQKLEPGVIYIDIRDDESVDASTPPTVYCKTCDQQWEVQLDHKLQDKYKKRLIEQVKQDLQNNLDLGQKLKTLEETPIDPKQYGPELQRDYKNKLSHHIQKNHSEFDLNALEAISFDDEDTSIYYVDLPRKNKSKAEPNKNTEKVTLEGRIDRDELYATFKRETLDVILSSRALCTGLIKFSADSGVIPSDSVYQQDYLVDRKRLELLKLIPTSNSSPIKSNAPPTLTLETKSYALHHELEKLYNEQVKSQIDTEKTVKINLTTLGETLPKHSTLKSLLVDTTKITQNTDTEKIIEQLTSTLGKS